MDELDDVADDTWSVVSNEIASSVGGDEPMIRKPIPTACEMRMNSFLSGSRSVLVLRSGERVKAGRTGAAVHEESALLEKLSGHTAHMLAPAPRSS